MNHKENAIEIRNMDKSFRISKDKASSIKDLLIRHHSKATVHEVLKDISLDVRKGESVALIGTNGSGKSTLLKCMTRILYPNRGTIETDGKVTSLLELGAGFHPDFTGRENIFFNAAIFGLSHEQIEKRMEDIIAFSELEDFIDEPVRTYSSGMYMRLAFSIAINVDADILLIDEILAVGDQHFQNKCFEKLEELRDSDKTIVIVSHSLDSVKHLCSRAVWIYKGHIERDGDPTYVISEYLKQSAIDNQESAKESTSDVRQIRGVVNIDTPGAFEVYPKGQTVSAAGWCVCSVLDYEVRLELDGTVLESTQSVRRKDVYALYLEEYAGLLDPEQIGWSTILPQQMLQPGEHQFSCTLLHQSQPITSRSVRFTVSND